MARIALVNPPIRNGIQAHRIGAGPLGLGYIAACLLRDGHDVLVIDAKIERLTMEAISKRIADFRPAVLGVTAMTHEIHRASEVCEAGKAIDRDVLTIVGGPHTTALPERTLAEFDAIDVAVIGEGELTACELAHMVDRRDRDGFRRIQGIAYRDGQTVVRTPNRPWMTNIDDLPFPAWRLFPKTIWPLFAGRGCPFGCKFCQRVLGRQVRMRSVGNVLAEIDAMERELGTRGSWFQDETFALNRHWADEFLTKLEARNRRSGYVWRWQANSRANLADPGLYARMKTAGCWKLEFGVESGNPEILKRIGKNITIEMAIRAVATAKGAGLETAAFFIIGHPGETVSTALDTVRLAGRIGCDSIAVGVMVPYPGTEIWQMARRGEYGYRLLTEDWRLYDKYFGNALEIEHLSRRKLEALQVATYLWFYLRHGNIRKLLSFLASFRKEGIVMLKRLTGLRRRSEAPQAAVKGI